MPKSVIFERSARKYSRKPLCSITITVYIVKRNINLIIGIGAIIGFSIFFWYGYNKSQNTFEKSQNEFFKYEFKNKVAYVLYQNHRSEVHCVNGKTLIFALDYERYNMSKYQYKEYSDFIKEGDSISKPRESKQITVKPLNRKPFFLYIK